MRCDQIREAISSELDGEPATAPADVVATHLATCAECRVFAQRAAALHRKVRVAPAVSVPDMTARILGAIGASSTNGTRRSHDRALRIGLALLGLMQLGIAVPALLGSDHGSDIHSARHLGSFSIALAVGFLFVAWRPSRVAGLVPVVAALVACVLGTSLLDLVEGHTAVVSEVSHVIEVAGLVTVWLLGHEGFSRRARVVAA